MARAKRLDDIDYYELLGVARDATADAIKHAFHAFARKYHPDQHLSDPTFARKSSRIYRRGTEAYRVLTNPEARRRYDEGLATGRVRYDPSDVRASLRPSMPPAQAALRTGRARPFVAKAQEAIAAKNFALAKLNLQIALQHEPGNTELERMLAEVLEGL